MFIKYIQCPKFQKFIFETKTKKGVHHGYVTPSIYGGPLIIGQMAERKSGRPN